MEILDQYTVTLQTQQKSEVFQLSINVTHQIKELNARKEEFRRCKRSTVQNAIIFVYQRVTGT